MKRKCLAALMRGCVSLLLLVPHGTPISVLYGQSAEVVTTPFSLEYIPRDAVAVFAARPGKLLSSDLLAPIRESIDEVATSGGATVQPQDLIEVLAVLVPTQSKVSPVFIMRLGSPQAISQLTSMFGERGQPSAFASQSYDTWKSRTFSFQPDATTIIFSPDESTLRRCLAAGKSGASTTAWAGKWKTVATREAAAVINTALLRGTMSGQIAQMLQQSQRGRERNQFADAQVVFQLSPLWQRSEYILAELNLEKVELTAVSRSASVEEAKQVHSALLTAVSVGRAVLSAARASIAERGDDGAFALMQPIDLADEILERARVVQQDNQVGFIVQADPATARRFTKLAAPAVLAARNASLRARSMNNLKQIALAFHNYHDTYKRFPAATQIGPKNVPHSWRITLLPFLGQAALYEQYRQDEPWDSERNRQVLAKMPEVFRCPLDQADSTMTSYFTFVGPENVRPSPAFAGNTSPRFADFLDGTSNTILAVETMGTSIPWTKPEDVAFSAEIPLRKLGGWYPGGFNVAMCDGSVRFLPDELDEQILRRAILRDDGNPLTLP